MCGCCTYSSERSRWSFRFVFLQTKYMYLSSSPVHCISIVNNEVGLACETSLTVFIRAPPQYEL